MTDESDEVKYRKEAESIDVFTKEYNVIISTLFVQKG